MPLELSTALGALKGTVADVVRRRNDPLFRDTVLSALHTVPIAATKTLPWFVRAMNAPERLAMLRGMRAGMPPDVFDAVLAMARDVLAPADHAKLLRGLAA